MYYRYETDSDGSYILDIDGNRVAQKQYSSCSLWTTTHTTGLSFDNRFQGIRNVSMEDHNPIAYPAYDASQPSNLAQHSYTAIFSILTDLLVGEMGFVTSTAPNSEANSSVGAINSPIARTSLVGSNDLDYVFALNRYTQGTPLSKVSVPYQLSDQRLLDKALAQNQTLPFLVEQLVFNITMSMMNDPLLAPSKVTNTTQVNTVNIYIYNQRNLWLAYGLAYYFVLLTLVVALMTIHENHASHNNSVSALLSISRDETLAALFPKCCRGKQPLPSETMEAELMIQGDPEVGESLTPQGKVTPVCRACNPPAKTRRSSIPFGRRQKTPSVLLLPR
ncbi:hypothetical protein LTR17_004925 [Elasticomyces elasticus]|nr:hypothetical protein LTR17_004925 [Elasticomyces elasticus]